VKVAFGLSEHPVPNMSGSMEKEKIPYTRCSVKCNLIMFVIMHTLYYIHFACLGKHWNGISSSWRDVPTYGQFPAPSVQNAGQTPRKKTSHRNATDLIYLTLPQPQGALSRSRINNPPLYCALLEMRTLQAHSERLGWKGMILAYLLRLTPSSNHVVLSPCIMTFPWDVTKARPVARASAFVV